MSELLNPFSGISFGDNREFQLGDWVTEEDSEGRIHTAILYFYDQNGQGRAINFSALPEITDIESLTGQESTLPVIPSCHVDISLILSTLSLGSEQLSQLSQPIANLEEG